MKTTQKIILSILMTVAAFLLPVSGQEQATENTRKLGKDQKSPAATINDMAWLAGRWTGTGLGGVTEEIWSPPQNGAMMGMFRYIRNEKTIFYEMMTLVEENGSLMLRLKHFHPNLKGWEEKDATVDFSFVGKDGKILYFNGLTFKPDKNGDSMSIYLALREKDGTVHEEVFSFKRVR